MWYLFGVLFVVLSVLCFLLLRMPRCFEVSIICVLVNCVAFSVMYFLTCSVLRELFLILRSAESSFAQFNSFCIGFRWCFVVQTQTGLFRNYPVGGFHPAKVALQTQ